MENPLDQFKKNIQDVRLSDEARLRMRERLVAHMRAKPAFSSPYQKHFPTLSPFFAYLKQPATALMLIMIVGLSSVTVSATEGALPGDALYPLKVNVVEPVRGLFALSPESKATWQASLTDTRLREVEQLAVKRELTPAEGAKSQERFDSSLSATQETLGKLSLEDPSAAAQIDASFTASLDEHERLLSVLGGPTTTEEAENELHALARYVRSKIKKSGFEAATLMMTATTAATSTATSTPSEEEKEQVDGSRGEVQGRATTSEEREEDSSGATSSEPLDDLAP